MLRDRLAYYCPRINHLKLYGPIIAEARRTMPWLEPLVVVPCEPLVPFGGKNREIAAGLRVPEIQAQLGEQVTIRLLDSVDAMLGTLHAERVRAVVNVGLRLSGAIRDGVLVPSRARGIRWCALGQFHEELVHVLEEGVALLEDWDVATTWSQAGVDFLASQLRARGVQDTAILERFHPIGFVELDQCEAFDRAEILRKYQLPADRPIVYFSPAARYPAVAGTPLMAALFYGDWTGSLRIGGFARHLWGRRFPDLDYLATYEQIVAELAAFARRHDATLIAKTRAKHREPPFVGRYVSRLISDGAFFPFRTLELMFVADLFVGMPTASFFEAAFLGKRLRAIIPFPPQAFEHPPYLPFKWEFCYDKGGVWNTEGVSEVSYTYSQSSWVEFRDWTRRGRFDTAIDPAARRAVIQKTIGYDDFASSKRFLKLVEKVLS